MALHLILVFGALVFADDDAIADDDAVEACGQAKCGWSCDALNGGGGSGEAIFFSTEGCGWSSSDLTQTSEGTCVPGANTKQAEMGLGDQTCKAKWQKKQDSMVKQPDKHCNSFTCAVHCAQVEGCGWSKSDRRVTDEGTCTPGSTTKLSEMDLGEQACKDKVHTLSGGTPCDRLKREYGLECDSCIADRDIPKVDPEWSYAECPERTEAEDWKAETDALFGKKNKDIPKEWKKTQVLFSNDCVWDVELAFPEKNWNNLTDDPALEQYVAGNFTIGGGRAGELVQTSFENVGIRFKGWWGSLRQCLNPFGGHSAACNKLSFKIKFDKFLDGQDFLGLKRLQLHAALSDPTYARERLSYSVFREMGIAAPRGAVSTITVVVGARRIVMGVYLLTEVIDSQFTKTYFPKSPDGNLYKEGWPGIRGNPLLMNDTTAPDPMDGSLGWAYTLRTNEKEKDLWRANEWSAAMASAGDDYELVKVMKEFTHVDQMARYIAVDRFVENWDGPINFRADTAGDMSKGLGADAEPMGWWNHNYFMYEDGHGPRDQRQYQLIAWDTDSTFIAEDKISSLLSDWFPRWDHPICNDGNSSDTGFEENGVYMDGPFKNISTGHPYDPTKKCISCHAFLGMGGGNKNMPPQCFKFFRAFAHGLRSKYMEAAKVLIDGPMDRCRLTSKVRRMQATLQPFIARDAELKLYPSITPEDQKGMLAGFTSEVESFGAEMDDMVDNIIPYWRNNYIDQVKCTDNYRAKDWGTSLDDGKHHFDHRLTNVVTEGAGGGWGTVSIMEGSYWIDRAPGNQSLVATTDQPLPTCTAQTLYDDAARLEAEKNAAAAVPAAAPPGKKGSKVAVAVVSAILGLVLLTIVVYACVPGAAEKVVSCFHACHRSTEAQRAVKRQSFENSSVDNNMFANPLALGGAGGGGGEESSSDAMDMIVM